MDSEDRTSFFEDGFQGFPRNLPDNCIQYLLFIIDDQLDTRKLLSDLEAIRKAALQLCAGLTEGYIWQRDPFNLQSESDNGLSYLHGTTNYGDSVEDEWLVVYLLRELTKSHPNLWVRVFDSDGEFLLVEAANVLPNWLSPELDSNRVWIHQGKLHVVPLAASSGEKRPLSLVEAIGHLQTAPDRLVHSTFIEAEAFYRLEKYPGQIRESLHFSQVTIPRKLACLIHERPTTIAPAVEAFYLREPSTMKPLISPDATPHFPPEDLVTVGVKFTKILFAQLRSQQFVPPPLWTDVMEREEGKASSSTASASTGGKPGLPPFMRLELGMKVACGFEMLATNASTLDNRLAREFAILLEDLEEDGDAGLPSDAEIADWEEARRDDDESWLDINFQDFDNELQGKQKARKDHGDSGNSGGFGSSTAQADLQRIVGKFESFLNDDKAGLDGAELEDMDEDDDGDDDDDSDDGSEFEDKAVSFDEEQFSKMMREMMGFPSDEAGQPPKKTVPKAAPESPRFTASADSDEEDEAIKQLSAQMEAELKGHGALRLDTPKEQNALEGNSRANADRKGKQVSKPDSGHDEEEEQSGDEVDIDYNLAKNLLESFKSQAGMAGPAGNILGMMGLQLPRDEDDDEGSK